MRMVDSIESAKSRAAEALEAVLRQVSQIKLKHIDLDSPRPDLKVDILAHVDVHGHSHTLLCKVRASGKPDYVRTALKEFQGHASQFAGNATHVLIAPRLSEEGQALCRESNAGFLDLEGNARLEVGDVFIGRRCLPRARGHAVSSETGRHSSERLEGAA